MTAMDKDGAQKVELARHDAINDDFGETVKGMGTSRHGSCTVSDDRWTHQIFWVMRFGLSASG